MDFQDQIEKEIKNIWIYNPRECKSGESICASSGSISEEEANSDSDLFDLDIENTNYLINSSSKSSIPSTIPSGVPLNINRLNLAIVPLDPISIKVCVFKEFHNHSNQKLYLFMTFYLFIL